MKKSNLAIDFFITTPDVCLSRDFLLFRLLQCAFIKGVNCSFLPVLTPKSTLL